MKMIDLSRVNIAGGTKLFDDYRLCTTIGDPWILPDPELRFGMIPGVAGEVGDLIEDHSLQLRLISRVTGCDEALIHAVMEAMDIVGCPSPCWIGSRPEFIPFGESTPDPVTSR